MIYVLSWINFQIKVDLLIRHFRDRGTNSSMTTLEFSGHCSIIPCFSLSSQILLVITLVHLDGTVILFSSISFLTNPKN